MCRWKGWFVGFGGQHAEPLCPSQFDPDHAPLDVV